MKAIWKPELSRRNPAHPEETWRAILQQRSSAYSGSRISIRMEGRGRLSGFVRAFAVILGLGCPVVTFCVAQAMAQSKESKPTEAAAPAAVPDEPSTTTASYGDWVLRCEQPSQNAARVCEIVLTIQIQGQGAPIAQVAVGRLGDGEPLRATALLPTSVSFPSTVQITAAADDKPVELNWQRCLPNGCFAYAPVTDEQLEQWRVTAKPGRLTFQDASGRQVALPVSYRGVTQALIALNKQNSASK